MSYQMNTDQSLKGTFPVLEKRLDPNRRAKRRLALMAMKHKVRTMKRKLNAMEDKVGQLKESTKTEEKPDNLYIPSVTFWAHDKYMQGSANQDLVIVTMPVTEITAVVQQPRDREEVLAEKHRYLIHTKNGTAWTTWSNMPMKEFSAYIFDNGYWATQKNKA
jgi:hypothetical protein